jgi:phage replication O-like protein O
MWDFVWDNFMSNPQCENGYTKISNELLTALCGIRISGEARQVLDVIFRKTYGYNKKKDRISLSQFSLITKLKRPTVCRAIKKLIDMKLIIKIDNDKGEIYLIQKDFDQWKPLSKKITLSKKIMGVIKKDNASLSKKIMGVIKKDNASLSKKIHTKDNTTKDNMTKEITIVSGEAADKINPLIKKFESVNPSYERLYPNKSQRAALERLVKKWGEDKVAGMIDVLKSTNPNQYAPTITTPIELENKLGNLVNFINKEKNKQPKIIKA